MENDYTWPRADLAQLTQEMDVIANINNHA